jgi:hypothetical protein
VFHQLIGRPMRGPSQALHISAGKFLMHGHARRAASVNSLSDYNASQRQQYRKAEYGATTIAQATDS